MNCRIESHPDYLQLWAFIHMLDLPLLIVSVPLIKLKALEKSFRLILAIPSRETVHLWHNNPNINPGQNINVVQTEKDRIMITL